MVRCFESLNSLAGRRDCCIEHDGSEPGATQFLFKQEVHARVRKVVNDVTEPPRSLFPKAAFRELLGSRSVHVPDDNGNLANFSTVELVSLPDSLVGCPRLYDVVPESSRHYVENFSMIKKRGRIRKHGSSPCRVLGPGAQEGPCEEAATLWDSFDLV